MIPLKLRISGFLSYRDPVELDFENFDLACISGQNGAGKSSLLDAITWALFGEARKRDESLINLATAKERGGKAEVVLDFVYENNIFRIKRILPANEVRTNPKTKKPEVIRKPSILEFQILDTGSPFASELSYSKLLENSKWNPLTEKSNRETQARINQTLRLDYDTFVNASFFLQGKADEFTQKNASERKAILTSILGLEIWETYKERTADRRKEIERAVDEIDGRLAEIDTELDEENSRKARLKETEATLENLTTVRAAQESALESIRKAAASLDQQLAAEKARLEEERRGLREQGKAISDQASAINKLTIEIESAKKSLAESEEKIAKRKGVEENRNAAREQHATLKAENELRKLEMDELKARIDQLDAAEGATCPLCGQALSEEHRRSTLKQLQREGKEKGDRFRANKTSMDDLAGQIVNYEALASKMGNAERERLNLSNSITQWTERIETVKKSAKTWETTGAKRLKEVETILASDKHAVEAQMPTISINEADRELLRLREQENQARDEVTRARQLVDVLATLRERKSGYATEREEKQQLIARHKTLERTFGKDGVPALLIEQALPQIEEKANDLLGKLTDERMHITFSTLEKYKDANRKDMKETLEIKIGDGAGQRDYEMYSGGERFRVDFAIRLALSEVLAQRKGARLQTLVIDEGFGSQDAQGRQRLIEAINTVKPDFAKILVITHLDELKDAFPTRIEVEKTERGSSVRVV